MELTEEEIKELKEKLEADDYDEEAIVSYRDGSVSDDVSTVKVGVGVINIHVDLSSGKRVSYCGTGD